MKYGFQGIVTESHKLLAFYNLPNIFDKDSLSLSNKQWNSLVKEAVKRKSKKDVKNNFLIIRN